MAACLMQRCVNIDWLEVYVLESKTFFPCDAEFFRSRGYAVDEREYGTRVYSQMFTILNQKGEPFLEVRRCPKSSLSRSGGLFPDESCHIRLTNNSCYLNDPIGALRAFLARFDYSFVSIFRIDICLDFTHFDRGDDPARFIDRYLRGVYAKVNQAEIASRGRDTWSGRVWNSISWGSYKSMVSTKFYCKSLELAQVKDKPYIRQAWFLCGLVDDVNALTKQKSDGTIYKPAVWRVEFSIKSSAKRWVKFDSVGSRSGAVRVRQSLSLYDTREKLLTMFSSLSQSYFRFKTFQEGVRKDRCPDKILFKFSPSDSFYKVDQLAASRSQSSDIIKLLIALQRYSFVSFDEDVRKLISELTRRLNIKRAAADFAIPEERVLLLRLLLGARLDKRNEGVPFSTLFDAIAANIDSTEGDLF